MSNGDRWNKRLQFTHKNQVREPDPAEFIKFVDKETDLVNDPLYSEGAVDQNIERKENEFQKEGVMIQDSGHSITRRFKGKGRS